MTVPVQGSGTFAVEAMLTSLRAAGRQAAGADQRRLRPAREEDRRDRRPRSRRARDGGRRAARSREIERMLKRDAGDHARLRGALRDHVGHPQPGRADRARWPRRYGKRLLIDSMSAFGAIPLDARAVHVDAIAASSNKCIEGVPGPGLRDLPQDGARPSARATPRRWCSTYTTSGRIREDRPVPLHAADPCHRRAASGA